MNHNGYERDGGVVIGDQESLEPLGLREYRICRSYGGIRKDKYLLMHGSGVKTISKGKSGNLNLLLGGNGDCVVGGDPIHGNIQILFLLCLAYLSVFRCCVIKVILSDYLPHQITSTHHRLGVRVTCLEHSRHGRVVLQVRRAGDYGYVVVHMLCWCTAPSLSLKSVDSRASNNRCD